MNSSVLVSILLQVSLVFPVLLGLNSQGDDVKFLEILEEC